MESPFSTPKNIRQAIHFDTLWQQTQQDLDRYSNSSWSDTAEHDPGVTLLQGLSYAVSDLAYRHTLPLGDLLTPEKQLGDGLFPIDFGPHRVLTASPTTADDYRRAILDLHTNGDSTGKFYFRDVQLLLLREGDQGSYKYWYDPSLREFSFRPPNIDPETAQSFDLQGGYRLLVELNQGVQQADALPALLTFLENNRNLCEYVGSITWLEAEDVDVELVVELEDDFIKPAVVLAQIYTLLQSHLSPQAERYSSAELIAQGFHSEAIFQGPYVRHGWITQLPPTRDYALGSTLTINPLANALVELEGVKYLQTLRFSSGGWEYELPANKYARLWGEDPLQILANGTKVMLMKRGQHLTATREQIEQALPLARWINEQPVTMPYGRWRNPGRHYPTTDKIPPCYGLQQPAVDISTQHLHQFMLPFEQLLANECYQLASLPRLLAFNRTAAEFNLDSGGQWPFAEGALANNVHADYSARLKQWVTEQRKDPDKELSIIGNLLNYFGDGCAPRTLLAEVASADYLAIERGYLAQHSVLGYARNQFKTGAISALQRRIAARLGLGKELFVDAADMDLRALPFYMVEHRGLLPQKPESRYDGLQTMQGVEVDDPISPSHLILTFEDEVMELQAGLLIELIVGNGEDNPQQISACMLARVEGNRGYLDLHDNRQLNGSLEAIMVSQENGTLRWRNSTLWLKEMNYSLMYVPGRPLTSQEAWLESEPFPGHLQIDDVINIYHRSVGEDQPEVTSARVVEINNINRQLRVERQSGRDLPLAAEQNNYRWYVDQVKIVDRFSFDVSLVFKTSLVEKAMDPFVIEAWIKQIIQDELPCHVSAQLLWLSDAAFDDFSWIYTQWQTRRNVQLGELSYSLMKWLALGMLPAGDIGINAMRIATEEQQTAATEPEWDMDYIDRNTLLYTPPISE